MLNAGGRRGPRRVLGQKSLSRMGVSEVPATRHLFNIGCIVSGALGLVPALARMKSTGGLKRLSGLLLMLGCLFLMGVALVPINDSVKTCFHDFLAFMFFGAALLAMIVSAVDDGLTGNRGMCLFTVFLVGAFFFSYFTTQFSVYEAIGVLGLMVWLSVESMIVLSEGYVHPSAC